MSSPLVCLRHVEVGAWVQWKGYLLSYQQMALAQDSLLPLIALPTLPYMEVVGESDLEFPDRSPLVWRGFTSDMKVKLNCSSSSFGGKKTCTVSYRVKVKLGA